jgi:hypothetical protein
LNIILRESPSSPLFFISTPRNEVDFDGSDDADYNGGMNIPGKAWPEGFPDITTIAGYRAMKNHPDYEAAKTGDTEVAVCLIRDLLNESSNDALKEIAKKHPNAVLVGIHAIEGGGKNEIPQALADYIGEKTGLETEDDILQSNIVGHTGAGQNVRLFERPEFEGSVWAGGNYIIIDDMVTMGSTIGELRNYIEHNGGNVVDVITLSTQHDNNKLIALTPETKLALGKTFGVKLDDGMYDMTSFGEFLEESEIYGGQYEALTESEAQERSYTARRLTRQEIDELRQDKKEAHKHNINRFREMGIKRLI